MTNTSIKPGMHRILNMGRLLADKTVCLTLDLEQDYGQLLDTPRYEGLKYLPEVTRILKQNSVPLTCFVQGTILDTLAEAAEGLSSLDIEFECHTYSHPRPEEINHEIEIRRAKDAYERYFHRVPLGYRSPSGIFSDDIYSSLAQHGYKYDSSLIPSIRPGVYRGLHKPVLPHFYASYEVIEFPATVLSSLVRIPLSLSYVELLGRPFLDFLKIAPLPGLVLFNFHLHDLGCLDSAAYIPFSRSSALEQRILHRIYLKKCAEGLGLLSRILVLFRSRGYRFAKLEEVYRALIA